MRKLTVLAAMLLSVLSVTACGGSGAGGPDASATTLEGEEFGLAEKRGEVVALYFMAAY